MTRREVEAATGTVGKLVIEWALAVQRGDPDAATYLGRAKAAALGVALPELQVMPSPPAAAGGAR